MGNMGSNSGRRRNHSNHSGSQTMVSQSLPPIAAPQPQQQQQQQQNPAAAPPQEAAGGNRFVFAAAAPYPPQYPNPSPPQYYHYSGYYPPPPPQMPTQLPQTPTPLPAPFIHPHPHHRATAGGAPVDHHHPQAPHPLNWGGGGRYPAGSVPPVTPYIEHQKAVTIRNDVNLKKETLRVEPDVENPGRFLVAFTFDATVAGSIIVLFFAKEGFDCNLTSMKESILQPVIVSFKEGLGQKFRQPPGTGIDFSAFDEIELLKEGEMEVYPLAVKAEASSSDDHGSAGDKQKTGTPNSQITQAVFEKKENGEYHVRVMKQILWVNGVRYELQEIYGIGNSVGDDFDGNDPGKECVICLSEPRDTTVLPCRHMCMCSECAKVLRFQTNRCPICRQPVDRLLEIKVNNKSEEQQDAIPAE